ncbi:MAG: nucleoside hydrolase [Clostridia bacterium]|nr:nucleoside hydrolase [Clostridia bacterium]
MKLVVFCDYGLDDGAATCDILSHASAFSSIDIVAIGGNVPTEVALCNAKKLLAAWGDLPQNVRIVDTTLLPQPSEFLKFIHGEDGMGSLFSEVESPVPVLSYSEWVSSLEDGFILLSLGPMTVVEHLLKEKTPSQFIFMGGNVAEEPNYNGYEFNHGVNRSAFSACVRRPHVAITMDTCRNPLLNVQESGLDGEGMMRDFVRKIRQMTFVSGEKGCYVWDDMAVKYLLHPEWFTLYNGVDKDGNLLTVAKYVLEKKYGEIIDL